jgi:hypothetical protein
MTAVPVFCFVFFVSSWATLMFAKCMATKAPGHKAWWVKCVLKGFVINGEAKLSVLVPS